MRLAAAAVLASVATPALALPQHSYASLALAPSGDVIASVEEIATNAQPTHGTIVVRSVKDGRVLKTIDSCATCSYSGLTFSAGGDLAWLERDRAAGTVALLVGAADAVRGRPFAGKTWVQITTLKGLAQTPRFSPDGSKIALLVTLGAAKESGATQPGVRLTGEIGEANDEQRIAVFDRAAGIVSDVKPISPANRYVYEYSWTPDGAGFVATTALGNGDNNWWVATLDAIDAQTGAVRLIAKPSTQLNFPRVSPDGKTVAYIGGLMSDFGSVGGDIWTVSFSGGDPVNITKGDRASVTAFEWTSRGIRDARLAGAAAQVASVRPGRGTTVLWEKPSSFSASDGRVAYSADGSVIATVVQDFEHAPAIFAGPAKTPRKITSDNDAIQSIAKATSVTWQNDGFSVQGWLLAPLHADRSTKAAMITIVHGGPSAANTPTFFGERGPADLLKAGYYVFLPNPRGSYGQGEDFTAANKRDFGGGDLRDILTGIDAVEKIAPIDDNRLGLTGGSYGGFMAMWANTQTNRFKAIIAGAGLSDWISYYGTNGIDQWMIPFFGKSAYDDPEPYVKASAITYLKRARTPTFIYVGERDIEVPPGQSIEYWHGLKELGVPTSLVIYPDEGHAIRGPANVADLRKRTLAWFNRYLAGK